MQLNDIVETSRRVGEVSGRLAKIDRLAGCLRRAVADETRIAVAWLSGELRQGRIGIGYAVLREAMAETATDAV
jgi:DNA ligase-1